MGDWMNVNNTPIVDNDGTFIVPEEIVEPMWNSLERYGIFPYHPTIYSRIWTWVEVQIRTIFRCRRCGRSRSDG